MPRTPGRGTPLETSSEELVERALGLSGVLAQELVEFDRHEEDDRRDVEVRGHGEQDRQAADRGLEVREGPEVPAEDDRLDEPACYDEAGADARPALRTALLRPVAHEETEG